MKIRTSIIFMLAALAVTYALPGIALSAEKAGKVVMVEGDVRVRKPDTGKTLALGDDSIVYVGDTVTTGRKGKVKLLMKDESIVTLGRSSTMVVRSYDVDPGANRRKSVLTLISGKVRTLVKKILGSDDSSFQVQTPTAVAAVRGTHLIVLTDINSDTVVACLDGEVYVMNRDRSLEGKVTLGPGDCSEIFEDMSPTLLLDCLSSGALYNYIDETTFLEHQGEGTLGNLLINSAELEDLESITVEDLQEIISWTQDDAYGQPGDRGGDIPGEEAGGSPFRAIPQGGSGGGGRASSPNKP